jgi:hypothetical protein
MSLPNITNYTAGYWGPSTVKNSLALLNPVADTGGTGQQQSQLTFYGVSTSGQGPTTPGQLGALTINRNPTGSATQNAGQAVLQLSSGTALSTVLTATSSLLTSAVTFSCANYDSSNSTVTFNVGGTPIFSLTSTSVTFNLAPSFPALTLAGTLYNSTSTLAFVVASTSVLSISTSGTLSLTGSAPILTATNTWSMQVAGTSVATLSTGEFALGTAIELSVPGTVAVSGTASATKLQVLDALSNPVLTVNTSTDKVSLAALQVTSFSSAGTVVSDSSGNLSIGGSGDTFNNTTLTGTTSVTGIIGVTGSASTGKLQVLDAGSAIVLGVDTTVDVVTAKALTVSSFSTAGPVVSSSAGVLSVSSTLAGITLTGTNTVTGTLGISGTANATKLQVLDASSVAVLTVNTSTDAVTTKNNTLDDGSGNATFAKTMLLSSVGETIFQVDNGVGTGPIFTINSQTFGSEFITLSGNVTVLLAGTVFKVWNNNIPFFNITDIGVVTTTHNILDNGGSATFAGAVTINTSTANQLLIENGGTTYFNVNAAAVTTNHNTLDDGTGNVSIAGTTTITATNTATLNVKTASANVFTVDTSTPAVTLLGSSATMLVVKSGTATALTVNTSTSAVTTKNNTLDNGSGNVTIVGNITQTGSTTLSTGTGNISLNGSIITNIAQTGSTTLSTGTGNISLNGSIITNIAQTGSTTLSTGTGAISLNGATTISNNSLTIIESTNGTAVLLNLENSSTGASSAVEVIFTSGNGTSLVSGNLTFTSAGFGLNEPLTLTATAAAATTLLSLNNTSTSTSSTSAISFEAGNGSSSTTGAISFSSTGFAFNQPVASSAQWQWNNANATGTTWFNVAMPFIKVYYGVATATSPGASFSISTSLPTGVTYATVRFVSVIMETSLGAVPPNSASASVLYTFSINSPSTIFIVGGSSFSLTGALTWYIWIYSI